jgi:hypothetical protein
VLARDLPRLCASFAPLGEHTALIVPQGDDEADVVLESLMQLFVRTHGGSRSLHRFPATAPASLQARLGATLPQADLSSVRAALEALIDLLENDLVEITDGQPPFIRSSPSPSDLHIFCSGCPSLTAKLYPSRRCAG